MTSTAQLIPAKEIDGVLFVEASHISKLQAEIVELKRELENERARDIHSCGPDCSRAGCVNRRLRDENEALRKFVLEVSKQTPEKPDYWSSCGQCGSNISEAEDILAAMKGQRDENYFR